jgi:hypothetical protein
MKWLWGASEFVRRIRSQMRFGERSRAPLRLLRLEVREDIAECEWMARPNDPWDADLPMELRSQNELFQALRDALSVREALFQSLPEVRSATVKVYRRKEQVAPELIISGIFSREDEPPARLSSLVMQAKLCGLRFNLSDGAFESLGPETRSLQLLNP